jgi:hypothetical protein
VLDNGTWYTAENVTNAPRIPGREFVNITLNGVNTPAPEECLYKISGIYSRAVIKFLSELLEGSCYYDRRQGNQLDCTQSWWLAPLYNNQSATVETVSSHMEGLSLAITNRLRQTGFGAYTSQAPGRLPAVAVGDVYETTTCTTVEWRWLLWPVILVAATALLLAWMILRNYLQSSRQPVWKGNILPLQF